MSKKQNKKLTQIMYNWIMDLKKRKAFYPQWSSFAPTRKDYEESRNKFLNYIFPKISKKNIKKMGLKEIR